MGAHSHKCVYSMKSSLTVRCIFHFQPSIAVAEQSQSTLNCLANSYDFVKELILMKFW